MIIPRNNIIDRESEYADGNVYDSRAVTINEEFSVPRQRLDEHYRRYAAGTIVALGGNLAPTNKLKSNLQREKLRSAARGQFTLARSIGGALSRRDDVNSIVVAVDRRGRCSSGRVPSREFPIIFPGGKRTVSPSLPMLAGMNKCIRAVQIFSTRLDVAAATNLRRHARRCLAITLKVPARLC